MGVDDDHRWAFRLSVALSVVTLTLVVLAFVVWWRSSQEWAPLGPFPEQQVLHDQMVQWKGETYSDSSIDIPAVPVTGSAKVEGTKCSEETVEIRGSKSWLVIDPKGFVSQQGTDAVSQRQKGCRTAVFDNPIPTNVHDYAVEQFAQGRPFVVAQISGCETPQREDESGVTTCWRTEPFALVP